MGLHEGPNLYCAVAAIHRGWLRSAAVSCFALRVLCVLASLRESTLTYSRKGAKPQRKTRKIEKVIELRHSCLRFAVSLAAFDHISCRQFHSGVPPARSLARNISSKPITGAC